MSHRVERLSRKDAAAISRVYKEVWPKAYEYPEEWRRKRAMSEEEVLKEMDAGYMFFGVRVNGELVGVYKASFTDRGLFGEQLAVLPSHRNQGIANALYEHFLEFAEKNKCRGYVNILMGHEACERVIRRYGFKKVGEPWEQSEGMLVQTYERDFSNDEDT